MNFLCIGVNGYAGDRTPHAMSECHPFTTALGTFLHAPISLHGQAEAIRDLPWKQALIESSATLASVARVLKDSLLNKFSPILITPRCASAIASLPVIAAEFDDVIVIYFDAHGDMNMPQTSISGYLGGMPITAALGEWESGYGSGLKANNIIHVGGRDLDVAEQEFIKMNSITMLTKDQIEKDLNDFTQHIQGRFVYVHIDTDVYEPSEVVAEYSVENGLFREHVDKILNIICTESKLVGIEITELSPKNSAEQKRSYEALFDSLKCLKKFITKAK